MRLNKGLPSLRRKNAYRVLTRAFAAGGERFGFRLIHFSIQSNHLHLLAEAENRRALARGMQGLSIRIARGLNRLWRRTAKVLADRYHDHILRTPTEVRNAIRYVLHNVQRHGIRFVGGFDPFTSAGGQTIRMPLSRSWLLTPGLAARASTGLVPVPGGSSPLPLSTGRRRPHRGRGRCRRRPAGRGSHLSARA